MAGFEKPKTIRNCSCECDILVF